MKLYEGMFILHNREITDETAAPEETVTALLEKSGAQVESASVWSNRKLAYPIAGNQTGTYVLAFFSGDPGIVAEVNRLVSLSDRCLRCVSFAIESIPDQEELAAMMENMQQSTRRDVADAGRSFTKEVIDYKNIRVLRRVITAQGKIFSRKRSGANAKQQRQLRAAVMRARQLALLPFVSR